MSGHKKEFRKKKMIINNFEIKIINQIINNKEVNRALDKAFNVRGNIFGDEREVSRPLFEN